MRRHPCSSNARVESHAPFSSVVCWSLAILAICPLSAQAVVSGQAVYVDAAAGNDSNAGTSATTPWKTLAHTAANISAAPAVYLKCGSTWSEPGVTFTGTQLKANATITTYGCANNYAFISGAQDFSGAGWTHTGNVWSRTLPAGTKVTQLFVNGSRWRVAQWPNWNGLATEYASPLSASDNPATATQLNIAATDWTNLVAASPTKDLVGATVWAKTATYSINSQVVSAVSQSASGEGLLTLTSQSDAIYVGNGRNTYNYSPGIGYILSGKRWMLDVDGEYVQDGNTLYVYSSSGDPTASISGTVSNGLVISGVPGVTVSNITFQMIHDYGLRIVGSPNATVTGTVFSNNENLGIQVESDSPNATIKNSNFLRNGYEAINANSTSGVTVSSNYFWQTGTSSPAQAYYAIDLGSGGKAAGNWLLQSAGGAIRLSVPSGASATNNIVEQACLRFSDCGGIYTRNTSQIASPATTTISGNIVNGVYGNASGAPTAQKSQYNAVAIYLDDWSDGVQVTNNTVANAISGLMLHNNRNVTVSSNRFWLTTADAIDIQHDTGTASANYGTNNLVTGNQLNTLTPLVGTYPNLPAFPYGGGWAAMLTLSDAVQPNNLLTNNKFYGNSFLMLQGTSRVAALFNNTNKYSVQMWRNLAASASGTAEGNVQSSWEYAPIIPTLGASNLTDTTFTQWTVWRQYSTGMTGSLASGVEHLTVPANAIHDVFHSPTFTTTGMVYLTADLTFHGNSTYGEVYNPGRSGTTGFPTTMLGGAPAAGAQPDEKISYAGFANSTAAATDSLGFGSALTVDFFLANLSIKTVSGYQVAPLGAWAAVSYGPWQGASSGNAISCATFGWPTGCQVIDASTGAAYALPTTVPVGDPPRLLLLRNTPWVVR